MTNDTHSTRKLYLAIECASKQWKLAFGDASQHRVVAIAAGYPKLLEKELERAKAKFGLPADTPVYSCYEAGRDGFWIHRMLTARGVTNVVVDPASIEVKRRGKRVKTDRLDATKLLQMLLRYWVYQERKTWSVLRIPSEAEEAARRPHRERERLIKERTALRARFRSLLATQGISVGPLPKTVEGLKDWEGKPLGAALAEELTRLLERLEVINAQVKTLGAARASAQREGRTASAQRAQKLEKIKGVGPQTSWDLSHEFFWRRFGNRREVGAAAGLVGCPYDSGESQVEQGISKAGNARVRAQMIELAWRWLRHQPQSELTRWYQRRFGSGPGRLRRIGIVALARKLLVAFWKYLEQDLAPEGAVLTA